MTDMLGNKLWNSVESLETFSISSERKHTPVASKGCYMNPSVVVSGSTLK